MTKPKRFDISKREVWEAFKKVKANQGAAGVDGQSIEVVVSVAERAGPDPALVRLGEIFASDDGVVVGGSSPRASQ